MDKDNYDGKNYRSIIKEIANIPLNVSIEILNKILGKLAKELLQIRPYAGASFLENDKSMMEFWKGQYIALERIRKFVEEKRLQLMVEEDEGTDNPLQIEAP